jgi:hypothetical protein
VIINIINKYKQGPTATAAVALAGFLIADGDIIDQK